MYTFLISSMNATYPPRIYGKVIPVFS